MTTGNSGHEGLTRVALPAGTRPEVGPDGTTIFITADDQTNTAGEETVFEIETVKLRWPMTGCGGPERRFRFLMEQAKMKFAAVAPKKRERRRSRFTKAELKRVFKVGGKFMLSDGSTIVGPDDQTNIDAAPVNDWDEVVHHAHQKRPS